MSEPFAKTSPGQLGEASWVLQSVGGVAGLPEAQCLTQDHQLGRITSYNLHRAQPVERISFAL